MALNTKQTTSTVAAFTDLDLYEKIADIGNGRTEINILSLYIYVGSFGKVCKIRRKSDGMVMVWKEL